jgi:hypothetical protein
MTFLAEAFSECLRRKAGFKTLLKGWEDSAPKFCKVRVRTFAPKEFATQLCFQLLYRPGQRRLGDVTFFRGTREVQRFANRQSIANLM